MAPDKRDLLPIGEIAHRSGLSVATVRYYEERGLIQATRTSGNQRRYPRHVLRRLAMIRAGQRFGMSLDDIGGALAQLPDGPPRKRDWERLSRHWHDRLQARIEALQRLRDTTDGCIGCGCLSTTSCPLYNPEDALAAEGTGARRWPAELRAD